MIKEIYRKFFEDEKDDEGAIAVALQDARSTIDCSQNAYFKNFRAWLEEEILSPSTLETTSSFMRMNALKEVRARILKDLRLAEMRLKDYAG